MSTSPTTGIPPLLLAEIESMRRRRRRLERAGIVLKLAAFLTAGVTASLLLDWHFEWTALSLRLAAPFTVTGMSLCLLWALSRRAHLLSVLSREAKEIDLLLPPQQEESGEGADPFLMAGSSLPLDETLMLRNRLHAEAIFPVKKFHSAARLFLAVAALSTSLALLLKAPLPLLLHRFLNPFARIPLTRILVERLPKWVPPGTDLEINATIFGKLPGEVLLRLKDSSGLQREFPVPLFGRRMVHPLSSLTESVSFQICAGSAASKWTTVTALYPPSIKDLSLRVIPPPSSVHEAQVHTQWPPSIHAPVGSRIVLEFHTQQTIVSAFLQRKENTAEQKVALLEPEPRHFRTTWEGLAPHSFSLELQNALGQTCPPQSTSVFLSAPEVPRYTLLLPAPDSHFGQKEDPLFEAELTCAEAVERWGFTLHSGGGSAQEFLFGTNKAEARTLRGRRAAALAEDLTRSTNTLIWFFWYEAAELPGSPKRIEGDLFFGTYSTGEKTSSLEQAAALPRGPTVSQEMLEVQKSVLAAIWNLVRKMRESPASNSLPPELLSELEAVQRCQKRLYSQTATLLLQTDRQQAQWDRFREAESTQAETLSALESVRRDASRLATVFTLGCAAYEALFDAVVQEPSEDVASGR